MYNAIDIANWFINQFDKESGDVVTHLKVQKLLYYAEAWTQLLLERQLFEENIEAWAHGPVVREVFDTFKDFGWQPLSISEELKKIDPEVEDVLFQVMDAYGEASAKTLENMTHMDRPWINARGGLAPEARCNNVIPKNEIKAYFNEKYGEQLNG